MDGWWLVFLNLWVLARVFPSTLAQQSPSSLLRSRYRTPPRCTLSVAYSGSTTRRCAASAPARAEGKAFRHLVSHSRSVSESKGTMLVYTHGGGQRYGSRFGDVPLPFYPIKHRRVKAVARVCCLDREVTEQQLREG